MLAAITNAKQTITLENFIFRSGKLSAQLVPALCDRVRAGVKVHVIMDSMGCSKLRQDELDTLEKAGVNFVKYNRRVAQAAAGESPRPSQNNGGGWKHRLHGRRLPRR